MPVRAAFDGNRLTSDIGVLLLTEVDRRLGGSARVWLAALRGLASKTSFWREAQFDMLRLGPIEMAARVTETKTRIKLPLPTGFPYRESSAMLATRTVKLPA